MRIVMDDIEANVSVTTHYRSAPACSNPDSPSFSDPGDDCEFEILSAERDGKSLSDEEIADLYEDSRFYELVVDADYECRYRDDIGMCEDDN